MLSYRHVFHANTEGLDAGYTAKNLQLKNYESECKVSPVIRTIR